MNGLLKKKESKPSSQDTTEVTRIYRAHLLSIIDHAIEHGSRRQRNLEQGQNELFTESDPNDSTADLFSRDVTPLTEGQQLAYEKEALGLYLSGHPIDRFLLARMEREGFSPSPPPAASSIFWR